jgi:RimJ/RimL family protein N-acetyltransferase
LTVLSVADAPAMRAIWAERPGQPVLTPGQAREGLSQRVAEHELTGIHCFGLRLHGSADVFGYCGLVTGRTGLDEPELAYELLSHAHNHGYATEAAGAVSPAAAATGRSRLWSTVRVWNTPSLRVLAKNGFTRDHSEWDTRGELIYLRRELRPASIT